MSQTRLSGPPSDLASGGRATHSDAGEGSSLSTLVYRSRAVRPFSGAELVRLTKAAQSRNRSEAITGLILYDDAHFFQWLEGPADSLSRVMQSINNDGRHTDIEVLSHQETWTRTFAGWDMKLAAPGAPAASWTRDVITPSRETLDALRQRPEIAAAVLEMLAPGAPVAVQNRTAATLERVFRTTVVPELAARLIAPGPPTLLVDPRAAELADLALIGDRDAILHLVIAATRDAIRPHATLFEPAARLLGDWWADDTCSELDVTLGLCQLQSAIRQSGLAAPLGVRVPRLALVGRSALVAPHPGELHGFGAALASDALRDRGWVVQCEFPLMDAALQDLLAGDHFDLLDLSLSVAFPREDRLPAMAETIRLARRASRNLALTVVAGGRIFAERGATAAQVGADAVSGQLPET